MVRDLVHRNAFEQQGETYVRLLAQRQDEVGREAIAWLGEQQVLRDEATAKLRDAREEETLQLARDANAIAERSVAIAERAALTAGKSMQATRYSVIVAVASIIVSALVGWLAVFGK